METKKFTIGKDPRVGWNKLASKHGYGIVKYADSLGKRRRKR